MDKVTQKLIEIEAKLDLILAMVKARNKNNDSSHEMEYMKQQTAVEWLEQKIFEEFKVPISYQVFEQAKQIEKAQLKDAHIEGQRVFDKHDHTEWTNDKAEQYYNKTYKK